MSVFRKICHFDLFCTARRLFSRPVVQLVSNIIYLKIISTKNYDKSTCVDIHLNYLMIIWVVEKYCRTLLDRDRLYRIQCCELYTLYIRVLSADTIGQFLTDKLLNTQLPICLQTNLLDTVNTHWIKSLKRRKKIKNK